MLAVVGVLVQELYQWNDSFPSKNFLEALKTAPPLGLLQLFVFLGAYDVTTSKFEGRVPGGTYVRTVVWTVAPNQTREKQTHHWIA